MTSHALVPDTLTMTTFNFELNGRGDRSARMRAHRRIRDAGVHLLLRQEMFDADANAKEGMYEAEQELGLRGWLSEGSYTAVFADTSVFTVLREWPSPSPVFKCQPTAVTLQLHAAGPASIPLTAVAAHLSYASPTLRAVEAELLTTFHDKKVRVLDGQSVRKSAMVIGLDANSYPHRLAPGESPLPHLDQIEDEPHRAHRSRPVPGSSRAMDTHLHDTFRTAGLTDLAQHAAHLGESEAVHPSIPASDTHGPANRIDWLCASTTLLPALRDIEVIDMQNLSDHNMVLARFDHQRLAELLTVDAQGTHQGVMA
ncbi:hypothetical protein SAMN05421773_104129 [Streptomyces aidingensis]|uniref:Endonuclease/Exonuclease/phosphatase family protein n=1 Tax=Streptomyces aidingensis TaxID=910347 RepID=A0A1I1K8P5_9ACTN|nr:hypothetical protein SAMN05421773_104129 [Streptomyces aidingensis]